jgi:hypothetical protein
VDPGVVAGEEPGRGGEPGGGAPRGGEIGGGERGAGEPPGGAEPTGGGEPRRGEPRGEEPEGGERGGAEPARGVSGLGEVRTGGASGGGEGGASNVTMPSDSSLARQARIWSSGRPVAAMISCSSDTPSMRERTNPSVGDRRTWRRSPRPGTSFGVRVRASDKGTLL